MRPGRGGDGADERPGGGAAAGGLVLLGGLEQGVEVLVAVGGGGLVVRVVDHLEDGFLVLGGGAAVEGVAEVVDGELPVRAHQVAERPADVAGLLPGQEVVLALDRLARRLELLGGVGEEVGRVLDVVAVGDEPAVGVEDELELQASLLDRVEDRRRADRGRRGLEPGQDGSAVTRTMAVGPKSGMIRCRPPAIRCAPWCRDADPAGADLEGLRVHEGARGW